MDFPRSGRLFFILQWILAVLVPAWLFLGRGLVGAELGWLSVIGIVYGAFVTLFLLTPPLVTLLDREVRRRKSERTAYSVAMWVAWGALVIGGLVVPDAGDSGHLDAALTVWTGGAIGYNVTEPTFAALMVLTVFALVAALAFAITGAVRSARASRPGV